MRLKPSCFPMVLSVLFPNARKYPSTFSSIRATHTLLLFIVFLKIYFVFIYKLYFHKVLNSRSAFQTCQFIVYSPLLFLSRSLFLKALCLLFLASFIFLAVFIIFPFVFVSGSFTMNFLLFFPLRCGLLLVFSCCISWLF